MAVTPETAVVPFPLAPTLYGATCLALATTAAVPLVSQPDAVWAAACAVLGIGVLWAGGSSWRVILGEATVAVAVVLLLRLPMEGGVLRGAVVPGWSALAGAMIAPGGRAWSEGPAVYTEAVDGTLAIRCDFAKCAAWEMASIVAVLALAIHRHGRVPGPLSFLLLPAVLVATIGMVRFVAIATLFSGIPNVLVPKTPSPLTWFWRPDLTAGVFLAFSIPAVAVLARRCQGPSHA